MHNASSYHSLPALLSGLHETLGGLAMARSGNASAPAPAFTLKSHPLPLTSEQSVQLDSILTVRFFKLCGCGYCSIACLPINAHNMSSFLQEELTVHAC